MADRIIRKDEDGDLTSGPLFKLPVRCPMRRYEDVWTDCNINCAWYRDVDLGGFTFAYCKDRNIGRLEPEGAK